MPVFFTFLNTRIR